MNNNIDAKRLKVERPDNVTLTTPTQLNPPSFIGTSKLLMPPSSNTMANMYGFPGMPGHSPGYYGMHQGELPIYKC